MFDNSDNSSMDTVIPDTVDDDHVSRSRQSRITANVAQMYQYIYGNWFTMIVYVYAELDIARLLSESPKSIEDIARFTGSALGTLTRFLRCAGALGLHKTDADTGQLSLTDLGALLSEVSPICLRAAARLNGASYRYQPWGHLLDYVKSGSGEGLSPTWERGTLEYLEDKPDLLHVFEQAMTDLSKSAYQNVDEDRVISESVDFTRFTSVLDVGCGNGTLLNEILMVNRTLRGALFDLENVLRNIDLPSTGHPNAGRIEKLCGDYRKSIPSGYDAYIMKNVIHNRPEHICRTLLQNIRTAIVEGSTSPCKPADRRLVMFEFVIPDEGEQDLICKLVDLNMNLLVGGSDRTRDDYESLLNESGFQLLNVSNLPGLERKVIEAAVMI